MKQLFFNTSVDCYSDCPECNNSSAKEILYVKTFEYYFFCDNCNYYETKELVSRQEQTPISQSSYLIKKGFRAA
ncbi:MAG: hypothetical protein NTY88_05140 [Bacteroidetes bacterium]|nr:hypothetical protein [Bacteroidota bacterium]